MTVKEKIRTIPNWPKEGVMFRDITTLIKDPKGLKESIDILYNRYKDMRVDKVVGIESRGFIFGTPLAYKLGVGFIPIRKIGKLPGEVVSQEYALEYGIDNIEIHKDAIEPGDRVIIVDDLIATGGTIAAAVKLLKKLDADIVECAFVVELPELGGREKIKEQKIFTLVEFEGE